MAYKNLTSSPAFALKECHQLTSCQMNKMDGLLTPISTSRLNANHNEPLLQEVVLIKVTEKHNSTSGQKPPNSPEEALQVLRHEPDYDQLVATLRFLSQEEPGSAFSIKEPSPITAQLVQALVSEIVPNYWALLNEDSCETNSSALGLLLACLRSLTGVNAIIVRLRALLQEAKSGDGKNPKRPDIVINLAVLLHLACRLLKGDEIIRGTWIAATRTLNGTIKTRMISQEVISTFGSGRIISLTAEATEHAKGHKAEVDTSNIWLAKGPEYTKWLSENIVKWQLSSPTPDETRLCSELFLKALRLGHSGKAVANDSDFWDDD